MIAKLENAGLLTRAESGADRRTVDVSLTEAGVRQAEEAKHQQAQRRGEMFSALTEGERAQLLGLLEKLNTDWENRYREGWKHRHGPHGERERRDDGHSRCDHDCANCAHPCGKRENGLE